MTLRDEIIAARRALDVLTMDIEPSSSTGAEDDDDELSAREARCSSASSATARCNEATPPRCSRALSFAACPRWP